jgi:radical SAM superfamily enzyme YgiQ (UPF0313 family)
MGTYLKKNGHEVKVLEGDQFKKEGKLDFSNQESLYDHYLNNLKSYSDPFWKILRREIFNFKPDLIGITVWTTTIASAIRTAQYCKEISPQTMIIVGGPHVTLLPDDFQQIDCFDIGVIGEGEQTILEIVDGIPLSDIDGIVYRESGILKQNSPRKFVRNLDDFGLPDRSVLIDETQYDSEDLGLIMTSRGCPFKCAYCATKIWKNKVRYRSIDGLLEEIKTVKAKYGTIYFTLKDDSFTIDRNRVLEFCDRLQRGKMDIYWECNANLSTLDREMLIKMRSSGCLAIKVGIESGSDKIHKIINKKLNNKIIISKMKIFEGLDIHLTCYFMIGIPGETKQDIIKTMNFAKQIRPDFISMSVYEIFPGTQLHKLGITEKTAIGHMEIEDYSHTHPHNYFFTGGKRHLSGMKKNEFDSLEKYVKNKIHRYNRLPHNIYKRIKSRFPLYRRNLLYFFEDFNKFLKWV